MERYQITSQELKVKLDSNESCRLLDVREPEEFEICHIKGSILIPLSELDDHLHDFDLSREYIVICKSGDRSKDAIQKMEKKGFNDLKELKGGIVSWATTIERTMEMY